MARHRHEEPHTHEPAREREVVVTGERRSGVGSVIAAIIGLIIVAIVAWVLFTAFAGTEGGEEVNVDVPEEVDVNVDDGGAGDGQ